MRSSWRWQILAATGQRKQTSLRDVTVQLKLARVVQHIGRMLTRQDKTRQGKSYYVYCEILAIAEINAWDPCIRWISRRLENLHSSHTIDILTLISRFTMGIQQAVVYSVLQHMSVHCFFLESFDGSNMRVSVSDSSCSRRNVRCSAFVSWNIIFCRGWCTWPVVKVAVQLGLQWILPERPPL